MLGSFVGLAFILAAPFGERGIQSADGLRGHAAILHRMREIEPRLNLRQEQMRAGGSVRHQAASMERCSGGDAAGTGRRNPQGEAACVAVTHHAERPSWQDRRLTRQDIHVRRGVNGDGFRRQQPREFRESLPKKRFVAAGLEFEHRGREVL